MKQGVVTRIILIHYRDLRGVLVPIEKELRLADLQFSSIPFEVKRVYWIVNDTTEVSIRGYHAHKSCNQAFFCLKGEIKFKWNVRLSSTEFLYADESWCGVYCPAMVWHEMEMDPGSVILALASEYYNEGDYIRDINDFMEVISDEEE